LGRRVFTLNIEGDCVGSMVFRRNSEGVTVLRTGIISPSDGRPDGIWEVFGANNRIEGNGVGSEVFLEYSEGDSVLRTGIISLSDGRSSENCEIIIAGNVNSFLGNADDILVCTLGLFVCLPCLLFFVFFNT